VKLAFMFYVFDDLVVFVTPGAEPSTSLHSIASGGGAVGTNEGDRWTFLKNIGVVRILGIDNTREKEPPNGSLVDRERVNRTRYSAGRSSCGHRQA